MNAMLMSRALILRTKRSHWRVVTTEQQKDRERERRGKGPTGVVTGILSAEKLGAWG